MRCGARLQRALLATTLHNGMLETCPTGFCNRLLFLLTPTDDGGRQQKQESGAKTRGARFQHAIVQGCREKGTLQTCPTAHDATDFKCPGTLTGKASGLRNRECGFDSHLGYCELRGQSNLNEVASMVKGTITRLSEGRGPGSIPGR